MNTLIKDLIPNAPQIGLYVAPEIPEDKLSNALGDFAKGLEADDVLALYDATLMGSAKDGAVFTRDRLVFQNNDLEPSHEVGYHDLVQVESKRRLLGGKRLILTVNRGRATFELGIDFSGKPEAAEYVLRFLRDAMLHEHEGVSDQVRTDVGAVRSALAVLRDRGRLSETDFNAILAVLEENREHPG